MKPPRFLHPYTPDRIKYHIEQIGKALSNISFGLNTYTAVGALSSGTANAQDKNTQTWTVTGTAPVAPNTEFAVAHPLHYVPVGYFIATTDRAGHIYKSTTAWTAATNAALGNIYLKADVASVAYTIVIF